MILSIDCLFLFDVDFLWVVGSIRRKEINELVLISNRTNDQPRKSVVIKRIFSSLLYSLKTFFFFSCSRFEQRSVETFEFLWKTSNNIFRLGTPYVVTVQTGNVSSGGTDAKVFITLNGDKNKISRRQLDKPEGGKDPFEKGNKDVFKFDDMEIGKVRCYFLWKVFVKRSIAIISVENNHHWTW